MLQFGSQNSEGNSALNQLVSVLRSLAFTLGQNSDQTGRSRVSVEAFAATIPTVTAVGTVTNQANIGGIGANNQVPATMLLAAQGLRNRITVS